MPRPLLPLLAAIALSAGVARAQERSAGVAPIASRTLERPEASVVVLGSQLEGLQGVAVDSLRLFAWRDGAARQIPFQVDELTPEEEYAYAHGELRRSDTDEGRLDANDELVFMARDVGPRLDASALARGQALALELEVIDPDARHRRGWVYLLQFPSGAPPRPSQRYVSLERHGGDVGGWTGRRVRATGADERQNLFDLHQLRFARPGGGFGPDVLDRVKLDLRVSYLFLELRRCVDEFRIGLAGYSAGPIRVVASYHLEAYLIWGHWIRSSPRCRVRIYENRLELTGELVLPVTLESNRSSTLRLSLDFAPTAGAVRLWTADRARPYRATGTSPHTKVGDDLPEWVCASFPSGSIVARLRLRGDLEDPGRRHRLFLADGPALDPPESWPGSLGNVGYELDLTGLPASTYRFELTVLFGPPLQPGLEQWLLAAVDSPLDCRAGPLAGARSEGAGR